MIPPLQNTTGPDLVIAGVARSQEWCAEKALTYPVSTLRRYDAPTEGEHGQVTDELVRRTRSLASRISLAQQAWFVERAQSLDLGEIHQIRDLTQLLTDKSAWEAADHVYSHFMSEAPKGVSFAKVHKVVHLVRPSVFPILDSRLRSTYWTRQKALSDAGRLPGRDNWRRRTWIAIGEDLIAARADGALTTLREAIASHARRDSNSEPDADALERADLLAGVSDLRLLDILTWKR